MVLNQKLILKTQRTKTMDVVSCGELPVKSSKTVAKVVTTSESLVVASNFFQSWFIVKVSFDWITCYWAKSRHSCL